MASVEAFVSPMSSLSPSVAVIPLVQSPTPASSSKPNNVDAGGRARDTNLAAALSFTAVAVATRAHGRHSRRRNLGAASRRSADRNSDATAKTATMERPLVDQMVVAGVKAVESAEMARVKASSENPSEENGGWSGEPREWADKDALTQKISIISQTGPIAQAKQFIADTLAGDYDSVAIGSLIDTKIESNKLMMFSFSTCPFCLKAKQLLTETYGVDIEVYECDLEADGYAVRAELGRRTGRTSMPSTWLGSDVLLGGCNDGGMGGVVTLHSDGKLNDLLVQRGAVEGPPWWASLFGGFGGADPQAISQLKSSLYDLCAEAPKNGVDVSDELKASIEAAASELEPVCQEQPARMPLKGVWDLVYCTAPGGSNGKVGPFVGNVTQTFVDEKRFINAVELFGTLKVCLHAEREIIDDKSFKVTFKEMSFELLGNELVRKDIKGQGVWKQRFVDAELRVMNTPSLFVLRKADRKSVV